MEPDLDPLEIYTGPCRPPYLCDFVDISRDLDEAASQKSKEDVYVWKIKSPRDSASGLPTGKRMHKPMIITKELDKSSPLIAHTTSGSQSD